MRTGVVHRLLVVAALVCGFTSSAHADSVAQIATSVRISRGTATLIDPQGRPGVMGMGTDTAVMPGDVLTFIAHFTPVPNGGVRGLGGYVTIYVPRNTEVVGVRFIDSMGATVPPHRGGLSSEGTGPRGSVMVGSRLGGSMSQLHADTGIFYATDPRTTRVPDGSVMGERFLTIFNGIQLNPETTAAGQLKPILGAVNVLAHNQWDAIQAYGFGVGASALGTGGRGNTPDLYGSPVAGPGSFYTFEASYTGSLSMPILLANVVGTDTVGPWRRIQTLGAEIGRRGVTPPVPSPGAVTRIGVPALDAMGRPSGAALNADNPLASHDAMMPTAPYTRAVRYAVGELVVGEQYLSEISLRVLATPLDPVSGSDTVCAEVFGGDASAEEADGSNDGKDNAWRYYLPAPSCVQLNLLFDLEVDKLVALVGERLTYTINGQNLSTSRHDNVVLRHCYEAGEVTFVSATGGGTPGPGTGCPLPGSQDDVSWTIRRWNPGDTFNYTIEFDARGGGRGDSTIGRAIFTSDQLPAPGFSTVAFTVIDAVTVVGLDMTATPSHVMTPPATVRYAATITNTGTGVASAGGCRGDPCRVIVTLPPGFAYVTGSARIGGAAVADPMVMGNVLTFTAGLVDIAPRTGSLMLEFDATVPMGTAPGAYTSSIETWLRDSGAGETVNDAASGLAEVVVGPPRSDSPTISGGLVDGATRVCGTTSEGSGATIRVYFGGVFVAMGTSGAGGAWCVTVPTLYAGQRVSATAQAPGELESLRSSEVAVAAIGGGAACSDGIDNDGDGLIDFPADPECASADDPDEAATPECADGIDNDMDGDVDFGMDTSCSSLLDDDESGPADCMDGEDDDGDGLVDFPADPGCDSAMDPSEEDLPECADGLDNDGDGEVDYPRDPECANALDDDEATADSLDAGAGGDAGAADAGVGGDGGTGGGDGGTGGPPDPGGVDRPDDGCGCRVRAAPAGGGWPFALIGIAWCVWMRRRCRR